MELSEQLRLAAESAATLENRIKELEAEVESYRQRDRRVIEVMARKVADLDAEAGPVGKGFYRGEQAFMCRTFMLALGANLDQVTR